MKKPMFDIFIGTKAQYIKTAPLMRLMQTSEIDYHLIDSGQHAKTSKWLRTFLKIKEPNVILRQKGNITTVYQAGVWFLKWLFIGLFRPSKIKNDIFSADSKICIIHGDTPTTLLSLFLAKCAGKKVAHLEAGLRSFNVFRPFPEEIIRIICMKYADILFAPSQWACVNIEAMNVRGKIVNIGQNTNVEALHYSLKHMENNCERPDTLYCIFTIHRVETILNRKKLKKVLQQMRYISEQYATVFVMHDPTEKKLNDFGMMDDLLSIPNLKIIGLQSHPDFLSLLYHSSFVVTDGGSIQEECAYMGIPCLVMRSETERQEGIGENIILGDFEPGTMESFLDSWKTLKRKNIIENQMPSQKVLNELLDF